MVQSFQFLLLRQWMCRRPATCALVTSIPVLRWQHFMVKYRQLFLGFRWWKCFEISFQRLHYPGTGVLWGILPPIELLVSYYESLSKGFSVNYFCVEVISTEWGYPKRHTTGELRLVKWEKEWNEDNFWCYTYLKSTTSFILLYL